MAVTEMKFIVMMAPALQEYRTFIQVPIVPAQNILRYIMINFTSSAITATMETSFLSMMAPMYL